MLVASKNCTSIHSFQKCTFHEREKNVFAAAKHHSPPTPFFLEVVALVRVTQEFDRCYFATNDNLEK